ncbi:MAG: hypothetical protein ACK5H2_09540 [Beutenbergiaceae bacterium]
MSRQRALVALLLVIATAAGMLANAITSERSPFGSVRVNADLGEDITLPPLTIHVHGAQAARELLQWGLFDEQPTPIDSAGVFVLVDISYASIERNSILSLGDVTLRDGQGREFPLSTRVDASNWSAGPDIWLRGDLVFEVAPDSLGSLELVLEPAPDTFGPMPVRYAVVPLPLNGDEVLAQAEAAEPELLDAGQR